MRLLTVHPTDPAKPPMKFLGAGFRVGPCGDLSLNRQLEGGDVETFVVIAPGAWKTLWLGEPEDWPVVK